jgi:small-conductance mechanosensitive channel
MQAFKTKNNYRFPLKLLRRRITHMPIAQLSPQETEMVVQVAKVVITLAATYLVARILTRALRKIFEKTPFPEEIEQGILRISKYVVYIVGIFIIVAVLGVDLTSLIVGLGAFSIAISFATSTIIQNMISGILVLGEKAFEIGDTIQIRVGGMNYVGKVVKIGVRATVIETEEGQTVYLPNSLFISNPLVRIEKGRHNEIAGNKFS